MSNLKVLNDIEEWLELSEEEIDKLIKQTRGNIEPRRWKGEDLRKLVRVNTIQRIYDAEKSGKLPPPDCDSRNVRMGYTLDQAIEAMKLFKTIPWRKEGDDPVVLSFTNFKGGCWKTTLSHYFTTWAANQGYRVWAIDLDPQGSLTRNLGLMPDMETQAEDTLAPLLIRKAQITPENVRQVIRKSHIPTLDFTPASLDLQVVEWTLSRDAIEASQRADASGQVGAFLRLKMVIDSVMDDYDLVVIDGTPTLGMIPLNIVLASDSVVVPVPTEIADFCSTVSFLRMLNDQLYDVNGHFPDLVNFPHLHFLPTRFSPGAQTTMSAERIMSIIKNAFKDRATDVAIRKHDSVVSNLSLLSRTAFDTNMGEGGIKKDAFERAMMNFSKAFDEIMLKTVFPHWPSKLKELEMMEVIHG